MIGPLNNNHVYPLPVDTTTEETAPTRKKRSPDADPSIQPENAVSNEHSRQRKGGGLDSLGRGNLL